MLQWQGVVSGKRRFWGCYKHIRALVLYRTKLVDNVRAAHCCSDKEPWSGNPL